ncbi:MAG: tetratricopeptide repeat protein [Planctomycetes bacterium]|nr:tetratricopeptide repeat protein [Planctomycetota bacterium]
MRQLRAIADCVGRGDDATAHRYLRELISEQLSYKHGEKHAVKSLCNIAQHCAEMYRTDFEHTCLVTAIDVAPTDGWAYTQFADHYKRLGQFEKALECLDNASKYGEDRIAQRSRADIYAMKGNYEEAFRIYDEITDIATDATLRTAKADLLRRMGKLEEAEAEYDLLETDGLAGDRVCAGRAEIAKRLGDMEAARAIYERILEYDSIGDEAKYIYSLALTNVLLRLADYEAAFRHADTAVQTKPFAHQARLTRAAAAGLLGDVSGALDGLPIVGQTSAFNEWIGDYVKGGLLLLLDRNDDARKSLIGKLNRKCKFADEEGKSILRLGAAACLLRSRHGVAGAAMILSQIESGHDAYAGWVRHALEYHVAVAMRNIADIDRLRQELSTAADPGIQELVAAIGSRAWDSVTRHEAQMILRLAS